MPTYAYRGSACTHEFETVQKFADAPLTECIVCGGPVRRVFQPVGVVFKGSGWYINDSRSTSKSGTTSPDQGDSSSKPGSADVKESTATPASTDSTTPAPKKESVNSVAKSAD